MSSPPIEPIRGKSAVYVNDGTGNFPTARDFTTGWRRHGAAAAVGDMDGDGLPDIVSGGSGGLNSVNMVTLNRSRRALRPDSSPQSGGPGPT